MDEHAHPTRDGTTIETDLCIVGSGPAGTALASELLRSGIRVVILESGGPEPDPWAQALNEGRVVGDAYAGLEKTRSRALGGTASTWNSRVQGRPGAKYTPLDALDMEARPWMPHSGWPFGFSELEPYYARAQATCGLGAFEYEGRAWAGSDLGPLVSRGALFSTRVYQLGARSVFPDGTLDAVRRDPEAHVYSPATVTRLETNPSGTRVRSADVASGSARWRVRAERFVLAGGAVENARLLLVSGPGPTGLGNESGWLGRCFMEHPRDRALTLRPRSHRAYRDLAFYDSHTSPDGTVVMGRLALPDPVRREGRLLGASVTPLPVVRPRVRRFRERLYRARLLRSLAPRLPRGAAGWSAYPLPGGWFAGFTMLLNLEQAPDPENRIVLSTDVDALGVPRPELHWRWTTGEQEGLEEIRKIVAGELEAMGLGSVEWDPRARPDEGSIPTRATTPARRA